MRLAFWRKPPDVPAAPPTPYDRWLKYVRLMALVGALLLAVAGIAPLGSEWSAPNQGADINVTTELYTAFERGGGFVTWDFEGAAARKVRGLADGTGNNDGIVTESEFVAYAATVRSQFLAALIVRNFEIGSVRVDESRGYIQEAVDSTVPAHLHITFAGQWAQRDADIGLGRDSVVAVAYGDLSGWERVHERTIIINGGLSTFTSYGGPAKTLRVPGGTIVVASREYTLASASGAGAPDVHFARFSVLDSSVVLLAPLAVAYIFGVAGPRREQEATRQPRVVPLHDALFAVFLLMLVAYFVGTPGWLMWISGVGFGLGGLWLAYQFYPAERKPEGWLPARDLALPRKAADAGGGTGKEAAPSPSVEEALALLGKAHGPLERTSDSPAGPAGKAKTTLAHAAGLLPKALTPLELPDDVTPRPGGRTAPPSAPPPPGPTPPPAPAAPPPAARAGPPKTRVRCPGCKHYFEAEGRRPLSITCPHCGRRGVLR